MHKVLKEAIDRYGKQAQTIQAIQELGELIVALTKGDIVNITEEVADVEIMIDQIKYMYGIDPEPVKEFKIKRLSKRLGGV